METLLPLMACFSDGFLHWTLSYKLFACFFEHCIGWMTLLQLYGVPNSTFCAKIGRKFVNYSRNSLIFDIILVWLGFALYAKNNRVWNFCIWRFSYVPSWFNFLRTLKIFVTQFVKIVLVFLYPGLWGDHRSENGLIWTFFSVVDP